MANKAGKGRKFGRNTAYCTAYKAAHKQEINKARRMIRHLKRYPGDVQGAARILHHDRHTPYFSVGSDIRALCTRMVSDEQTSTDSEG